MIISSIIIPLMTTMMKSKEVLYLNLLLKRHSVINSYTGKSTNVICLTLS